MAFYDKLVQELRTDPLGIGYAQMSNEGVAEALNAPTRIRLKSRFISLRTLASILTAEEYAAVKQSVQALAAGDLRVADMFEMLKLPCEESGATGGIDIGFPTVREVVQSLPGVSDAVKRKILALGEAPCARWEEIGLECPPNPYHVESARRMMGG